MAALRDIHLENVKGVPVDSLRTNVFVPSGGRVRAILLSPIVLSLIVLFGITSGFLFSIIRFLKTWAKTGRLGTGRWAA